MRRALALSALGLVVVALAGSLWACHVLKQTPFMAGPDRIQVCGRSFAGPGTAYAASDLGSSTRIGEVRTWQGTREVWGAHMTIGGAPGCGTGVYLRTGGDTFRGYALQGGP